MGRGLLIVALVGIFTFTATAGAAPEERVMLPFAAEDPRAGDVVTVKKGDHLWRISRRHLDAHSPATPVGPYWRRVVEVNTPNLRSRNPDLIYPGETVTLPEIDLLP